MYKLSVVVELMKCDPPPAPPESQEADAEVDPVDRDRSEIAAVPRVLEKMVNRMYPVRPPLSAIVVRSKQTYDVPNKGYADILEILQKFDRLACEVGAPAVEGMPAGPLYGG